MFSGDRVQQRAGSSPTVKEGSRSSTTAEHSLTVGLLPRSLLVDPVPALLN